MNRIVWYYEKKKQFLLLKHKTVFILVAFYVIEVQIGRRISFEGARNWRNDHKNNNNNTGVNCLLI